MKTDLAPQMERQIERMARQMQGISTRENIIHFEYYIYSNAQPIPEKLFHFKFYSSSIRLVCMRQWVRFGCVFCCCSSHFTHFRFCLIIFDVTNEMHGTHIHTEDEVAWQREMPETKSEEKNTHTHTTHIRINIERKRDSNNSLNHTDAMHAI